MKLTIIAGAVGSVLGAGSMPLWADDQPATATPSAPAGPTAMSTPSMNFPLAANPNPLSLDAGPLGKVYITGALTALGLSQNNAGPPICNSCDKRGQPYVRSGDATNGTFGIFPVGDLKLAPGDGRLAD